MRARPPVACVTGFLNLLLTLLFFVPFAHAADPVQVSLGQVDATKFPQIQAIVSVVDASGSPISGLSQNDFQLYEDGKRITSLNVESVVNTRIGLSVAIAVDTSGSMKGKALEDAKEGAATIVQGLTSIDQGAVIGFGSKDCKVTVHGPTNDRASLTKALEALKAEGDTPFYDAAFDALKATALAPAGRKVVILLTDGEDTCSAITPEDVINRANKENVPLYTIGLGADLKPAPLQRLSKLTGGLYLEAATSGELAEVFQKINNQLKNQYVITYRSQAPADGNQHTLSLRVSYRGFEALPDEKKFVPIPPPQVQIPLQEGQEVKASMAITPTITSQADVTKVEFYIDDVLFKVSEKPPFAFTLDPASLREGRHVLQAKAFNSLGNSGVRNVSFTIPKAGATVIPTAAIILAAVLVLPVLALPVVFRRRRRAAPPKLDTFGITPTGLPEAWLTGERGEHAGTRFSLGGQGLSIGRDSSLCQVAMSDPTVSRQHAAISVEAGEYYIADLESANGTKVNGRTITRHRLQDGDEIEVGQSVLRFRRKETGVPDEPSAKRGQG